MEWTLTVAKVSDPKGKSFAGSPEDHDGTCVLVDADVCAFFCGGNQPV